MLEACTVCVLVGLMRFDSWGDAERCCRRVLIISREQGLRYDAGFAVPVLTS